MKEPSRFLPFLPDFSSFFLIFPDFFLFFTIFGKFFAVRDGTLPPLAPPATDNRMHGGLMLQRVQRESTTPEEALVLLL